MKIQQNVNLKPYNTFGVSVLAKQFVEVQTHKELKKIIAHNKDIFILNGGSNMLLTKDIDKLVVKLNITGKQVVKETNEHVFIKVHTSENWHNFVLWCVDKNYGGIENLSLIPGNVGASPIQNIGAYGVEVKDVITTVNCLNIEKLTKKVFKTDACNFGYRNSIFKNEVKGKYIITSVVFKLTKQNHTINSDYGAIKLQLEAKKIKKPSIKDISNIVIAIRNEKLPNPKELGNSGSFFKNPIVSKAAFKKIQKTNKEIPFYEIDSNNYKIPAGWLIEQCGFKGKKIGNAGVYEKQALILVNHGNATGKEILNLAENIQTEVSNKFGINLETEVTIF